MCLGGSSGGDQEITQKVQLPPWADEGGRDTYNRATKYVDVPYLNYTGPRIASFAPETEQAFDLGRSTTGEWRPFVNEASERLGGLTTQWTDPGVSDSYMNPYTGGVSDIAARELKRAYDVNRKDRNAAAVAAGGFGDAQHGVAEAEAERNYLQGIGDIYTKGAEAAYQSGMQAFQSDRDARGRAAEGSASLAQLVPQLNSSDLLNLSQIGQTRENKAQQSLDLAYQDFLNQREYPYERTNWLSGILSGTPLAQSSTQTTSGGGPSSLGQYLGAAQSLGSLGMLAYMALSDRRLKTDIVRVGTLDDGLPVYRFRFKGQNSYQIGVMADEVEKVHPSAVGEFHGIKMVDYSQVGSPA